MPDIDVWETVNDSLIRFDFSSYTNALITLPPGVNFEQTGNVVELEAHFLEGVSL